MMSVVTNPYNSGQIDPADVCQGLMDKLQAAAKSKKPGTTANLLNAFLNQMQAQSGKHITKEAADLLMAGIQWLLAHP